MLRHAGITRRRFLVGLGAAGLATPALPAMLSSCGRPTESTTERALADPDSPLALPMNGEPIAADAPIESGATLEIYNWEAYLYKKVLKRFEEEFDCSIEVTTFNNMEEGIQKMTSAQVEADVFFPTTDYIARLVEADMIQPLQHDLIPNMEVNVWPVYWDPGPWYDVGWRYTVPYIIFTTGVGYRRDRIGDEEAAAQGYEMLWNPEYSGYISYYDSYRDAIGMALLRNGGTDPDSGDPAEIRAAADSILEIMDDLGGRLTINGAYAKLPEGEVTVAQAWSGDMVGAKWYLPKGAEEDVLGYWFPDDGRGLIGNDTMVIPRSAPHPRLAHEFVNFMLDAEAGYTNFAEWNAYQPPFVSIDPGRLIADGVVPSSLERAVVTQEMFAVGYIQSELPPDVDQIWADEWARIQAGG